MCRVDRSETLTNSEELSLKVKVINIYMRWPTEILLEAQFLGPIDILRDNLLGSFFPMSFPTAVYSRTCAERRRRPSGLSRWPPTCGRPPPGPHSFPCVSQSSATLNVP